MKLFTLAVGANPPTMAPLYPINASGIAITMGAATFASLTVTAGASTLARANITRRVFIEQTVVYSASMTIDVTAGGTAVITGTNGTAFTINAPTGTPATGEQLTVVIRNASGGALGAVTWNAIFKMSAWTQPANGFSRSITFRFDGTNWVQMNQTGVDVPN